MFRNWYFLPETALTILRDHEPGLSPSQTVVSSSTILSAERNSSVVLGERTRDRITGRREDLTLTYGRSHRGSLFSRLTCSSRVAAI